MSDTSDRPDTPITWGPSCAHRPDTEPVHNVTTVPIDPHRIDARLQVQVVPVFADTGPGLTAVYGSESALSRVTISERTAEPPEDVRVTDLSDALRVEWAPVADADGYEVHAAADPAFEPGEATRLDVEPACDEGVCAVVDEVGARQTRYYRVLADGDPAAASLLAPGTTQPIDREVLVRADTVYGPGYWQRAETTEDATAWRFRYATAGPTDPADPLARAFSQGIGSPATAASEPSDPGGPGRREEPGPPDHAGPPDDPGRREDRDPPRDPVPGDRPPPRGPDGWSDTGSARVEPVSDQRTARQHANVKPRWGPRGDERPPPPAGRARLC